MRLGGVPPQRGEVARLAAEATPLYRVDGAFAAIRKFALSAEDGWGAIYVGYACRVESSWWYVVRICLLPGASVLIHTRRVCTYIAV